MEHAARAGERDLHEAPAYEVRRAVADDWVELKRVRLAALAATPTAFGSTLEHEQEFSDDVWRSRAGSGVTFLAWSTDRVVGTASVYANPANPPDSPSLVAMYVEPSTRGTGCAQRLIDAVAEAATLAGARRLLLDVTEVNPMAMRCYRRYGFTETGRRQPLPHRPEIAEIEMVLRLA